jgi:hypothetical protein
MYSSILPPCVLRLDGFPGVGKLTIAKGVKAELGRNKIPHRLMDNHLLIDPVVAIQPIRNKSHYILRKRFREAAYEGIKELEGEGLVIIFTTCLSTSDLSTPYDDIDQFREYVDLAEGRGVSLVVVNIHCDLGTNSGRLCSKDRKQVVGGKTKLVDVDILKTIREQTSLLDREQVMGCEKGGNIFYFELDTSELAPEDAEQKVLEFLRAGLFIILAILHNSWNRLFYAIPANTDTSIAILM